MNYQQETKNCQNCKKDFIIEPDDFAFYEKIKVPPPTWCPECRMLRRLSWRNERSLHRRKCSVQGHSEDIISIYDIDVPFPVYDYNFWWSDEWDPMKYGTNYNFQKDFFTQWKELRDRLPHLVLSDSRSANSEYCNVNDKSKDCYMISASYENERVFYSNRVSYSKDSMDCYILHKGELCYGNVACSNSYRLFFSMQSKNCTNCAFLYDCDNCQDCFGCTNLRNKHHCFFNEQLTKEEYHNRMKQFDIRKFSVIQEASIRFQELLKRALRRYSALIYTTGSTGDNLLQCKNCIECFDFKNAEDCKFCNWGGFTIKDSYDSNGVGDVSELVYETFDEVRGSRILFSSVVYDSHNIAYSFNCHNSGNLFGCIGLRKKQYCILNKQYSKEEYEVLMPKIITQMNSMPYIDSKGRTYKYGEFFPSEFSPFGYNETVAYDFVKFTKFEVENFGYCWRESVKRNYKISIPFEKLPDNLIDVQDSITKEIIGCEHEGKCEDQCTEAFRITQEELRLYRSLGVAIPRLCFNCRHHARLSKRNPIKLYHRKCMKTGCQNEFETSYAPDRPEIVYCEACYNQEVA